MTTHATILDALLARARSNGGDRALLQKLRGRWAEITWSGYATAVAEVGEGLAGLGVGKGDRVAILVDNRPAMLYLDLGAQSIGAVSVPVLTAALHDDVVDVLRRVAPTVVVIQDTSWLDVVLASLPNVKHIVHVDTAGVSSYADTRLVDYTDLRANGRGAGASFDSLARRASALAKDGVVTLGTSSGATGPMRTFSFTAAQVVDGAEVVAKRFALKPGEFVLAQVPLAASAERAVTAYSSIITGAVVAFPESVETAAAAAGEIEPHFVHSPVGLLDASSFSSLQRLDRNRRLKKLVAKGWRKSSLGGKPASGLWHGIAGQFIVRMLGARRARTVLVSGSSVQVRTAHFMRALRLPLVDAYTVSAVFIPAMLASNVEEGFGETLDGVEAEVTSAGRLRLRGRLVSADALASGWYETNDRVEQRNGKIVVLGPASIDAEVSSIREFELAVAGSPYIGRAIVTTGSGGVGVLIEVEPLALSEWAQANKVPFTTVSTILDNAEAQQLFVNEVQSTLARMANKPRVGELRLLRRQLAVDSGDLTATGKLRRSRVAGIADIVIVRV
jgi:long-chain acyl-CoA synthetase